MQLELNPCPFCGSKDLFIDSISNGKYCWIKCNNCTAEIKEPKLLGDAIKAWNTRYNRISGKWIRHDSKFGEGTNHRECSNCGTWFNWDMPRNSYCPNCGAKMEG